MEFHEAANEFPMLDEKLGRKWIGIEIEEKYCEIAAKRIEAERQQLKMFA